MKIAQAITVFILSALVLGLTAGTASATMQKYASSGGMEETGYSSPVQAIHPFLAEDMKIGKSVTKYGALVKPGIKNIKYATVQRGGTFGMAGVESGNRYAGRGPGMGLGYKIYPPVTAPGPNAIPLAKPIKR